MRDPYDILGVPRNADDAAIKKAFRQQAKRYHPDQNKDDPKAQAKFAEVNTAYEILGDKDKRGQFDRGEIDADGKQKFQGFQGAGGPFGGFRQRGGRGHPGSGQAGGAGFNPEDILSEIFGSMGGGQRGGHGGGPGGGFGGGRQSRQRAAKGDDVAVTLKVALEDLVKGEKVRVSLPGGRSLNVALPDGVQPGQQIRLKGQGQPSPAGGPSGDAMITVEFASHPVFKPSGDDLRIELPLTLYEAVLGAKIRVPTLEGAVSLTIPAGANRGKVMRLRGKGLPGKSGGRGDLLVSLRIVLPDTNDSALEAMMRDWQDIKPYPVRGPEFDG
ncbi:J domain-containing protein [Coralliovum pocilloporae]|uniref:J domain-containing protein n=1 Tax=Coralliovum pocilloporae TaxID=3066369 RepID=UPI003306BEA0